MTGERVKRIQRRNRASSMKNLYLWCFLFFMCAIVASLTYDCFLLAFCLFTYLGIGLGFSIQAAPLSWALYLAGHDDGKNIKFWVYLWPWPLAAQIYKWIAGHYPPWAPLL